MFSLTKTEARRNTIITVFYYALIIGVFYFFMSYAFWQTFPLTFSFFIAMILQKPVNKIVEKTPIKKGLASSAVIIFLLLIAVSLFFLIGSRLISETRGLLNTVSGLLEDFPALVNSVEQWLLNAIKVFPDGIEQTLSQNISSFFGSLEQTLAEDAAEGGTFFDLSSLNLSWLKTPLSGIWSTARRIPALFTAFFIGIIACVFMTSDYDNMVMFIRRQLPEERRFVLSKTKGYVLSALGNLMRSYLIMMTLTFFEVLAGLSLLKFIGVYNGGYILAIAFVLALLDFLPIVGTGTVLIPWGIICLFAGQTGLGFGILALYGINAVLREIIEPKVLATNLGLSPVVSLIGMYIGLQLFGVVGVVLVPVLLIILKLLNDEGIMNLWRRSPEKEASMHAEQETLKPENSVK